MIIYSITFCRPPAPATMQPQRLFFRQLLLVVTLLVAQPVAAFTLSPGDVLVGRGFNTDSSREGDVIRVNVADGTFEVLVSGGMVRSPNHIATDHAGRIIIAEWQNGPIIAVEPDGGDQVIVGSGDLLKFPRGVAVGPDGHLYVSAGGFSDPDGRVVRIEALVHECRRREAMLHEYNFDRGLRHSNEFCQAPIAKDSGLPRPVIRFRILQAITTSASCDWG